MKSFVLRWLSLAMTLALVLTLFALPAAASGNDKSPNIIPSRNKEVVKEVEEEKPETQQPEEQEEAVDYLAITSADVIALYTAKSGMFTVKPLREAADKDSFASLVSSIKSTGKEVKIDDVAASRHIEASFLLVLPKNKRVIYTLVGNNVFVISGTTGYQIAPETYQALLTLYTKKNTSSNYIQWLVYMVPKNITDVTYANDTTGVASMYKRNYLSESVQLIRGIRVLNADAQESYETSSVTLTPSASITYITLTYGDEGDAYELYFQGDTLYLQVTGYRIGRKYTLPKGEAARIISTLKDPEKGFGIVKETNEKPQN